MKAKLVKIGNSRGVRLPKPLIEQAALTDEVGLSVRDGTIVISRAGHPRAGWAEAAEATHAAGTDRLLLEHEPTEFDQQEWEW